MSSDLTVIIPCYNAESTIERCFSSIVSQTLLPRKVIIVNDCSIDSTSKIINSFKDNKLNFELDVIHLDENKGPSYARNIAWSKCETSYLAFLDSDDAWHEDKIFYQYNFMKNNPTAVMTGHNFRIGSFEKLDEEYVCFNKINLNKLLFKNYFITPGVMLKNVISLRFDESMKYSEDYKLWLSILCNYPDSVYYSSSVLCFLFKPNFGFSGLSGSLYLMQKGEIQSFKYLYKNAQLNIFYFYLALIFSSLKFFRRLIVTFFRRF